MAYINGNDVIAVKNRFSPRIRQNNYLWVGFNSVKKRYGLFQGLLKKHGDIVGEQVSVLYGMPLQKMIHQTDLFHPHEDPDDHYDLATVFALASMKRWKIDGVAIDYPQEREEGDPAFSAVLQLSQITGISGVPVVVGHKPPGVGKNRNDGVDKAAAEWICRILDGSPEPIPIHIAGSCLDIAIAGKMCPGLFREESLVRLFAHIALVQQGGSYPMGL